MRAALAYFMISALNWLVICWAGWAWVLGADVPAWKMLVMAVLAGGVHTVSFPIFALVKNSGEKPESDSDRDELVEVFKAVVYRQDVQDCLPQATLDHVRAVLADLEGRGHD